MRSSVNYNKLDFFEKCINVDKLILKILINIIFKLLYLATIYFKIIKLILLHETK